MRKILLLLGLLAALASLACAKICWKTCTEDAKLVRSFDIDGCRRRRGQPGRGRPRFRCDGNVGPPCTVKRGDTVYLDVDFGSEFPFRNLRQDVVWMTSWGINMPWVGLDKSGCSYLDNKCNATSLLPQNSQKFSYPISIRKEYPTGRYNLKWKFTADNDGGVQNDVGCAYFTIRIL